MNTVVRRSVVDEGQTQTALDGNHKRFQDLRNDVLPISKVNVVTTDPLQIEHDLRKLGRRDFCAFAELARLKVLTKHAAQITPAEKDCAGPVPAAETILLAEMREGARHARESTALAHADLVVEPIDLAVARANTA